MVYIRRLDYSLHKRKEPFPSMKTLIYTIARTTRSTTQILLEAYLRRAELYIDETIPANHMRVLHFQRFCASWGYFKYRR